ncbi:hypothetical protein PT974_00196 [Cladobotryum mycophilum]|uniref:Aminoglycoside phosphotransferase domain-containing protein n=1 Tax=Cladobotryum mycophilum TaxID=491253 RepID=A0ABR0T0D6_9HYPO
MTNVPTLPTLNGELRLEDALQGDDNVLPRLKYAKLKEQFWNSLAARKDDIEALVCRQLGVNWCQLRIMRFWKSGSFNVVIPILLANGEAVHLRIPLPYKVGEECRPGNVEEKLRCEIATYLWIEQHCPDVPIPRLHAFGLPDGSTFTHPSNTPFLRNQPGTYADGYTVYSVVRAAKGDMLVMSWEQHRHDQLFRQRLFRDLARITLSMNRIPLPRIGSLSFNSDGIITLSNRPLNLHLQMYENEGIPAGIPRNRTYSAIEGYISDLLSFQDNKVLHQPNSIHSTSDGQMQLAALTALRAIMHHFIKPEFREGPFYLTHTDLHGGNIFVDKNWNISTIIDLEWAQSMPIEMQLPPYWLTSRAVDCFEDKEAVSEYDILLREYLDVYETEEKKHGDYALQANVKRDVWNNGGFWYFQALLIPKGMYNIFERHVQPLFNKEHSEQSIFEKVFFWYWGFGAQTVIEKKIKDEEDYVMEVKEAFGVTNESETSEPNDTESASQGDADAIVVIEQEEEYKIGYDTSTDESGTGIGVSEKMHMTEVDGGAMNGVSTDANTAEVERRVTTPNEE